MTRSLWVGISWFRHHKNQRWSECSSPPHFSWNDELVIYVVHSCLRGTLAFTYFLEFKQGILQVLACDTCRHGRIPRVMALTTHATKENSFFHSHLQHLLLELSHTCSPCSSLLHHVSTTKLCRIEVSLITKALLQVLNIVSIKPRGSHKLLVILSWL